MKRANRIKYMLRRTLIWGIALCMVVFMFTGLNKTAEAASYSNISADTTLSNGDTINGTISGCTVTIPTGATVTVTGQVAVSGTVDIVGGGKLIRGSSFTNASMIMVNSGATLNIGTSGTTGVIIDGNGTTVTTNGGGIYDTGGMVNLYSGANVTNHYIRKADPFGGGVYIQSGTLKMYDGASVTNNTAYASSSTTTYGGGGIAVYEGAAFYMYGGTISDNKAPSTTPGTGGGGVYNRGTFTMSGGTISGNTTGRNGGAVHLDGGTNTTASPVMTMTGGIITGNYSTSWAGGIEILAKSGLNISGGKINSNSCGSGGGGIELDASGYSGYLQVSGGAQVTGNTRGSLQDDVFIDKNITVIGNFTGSIGITHETAGVNAIGGVFGTNSGSYTGMQNFFSDEKAFVGELYGTSVRWKASTTALTGVTLSTNTPVMGTAITTTLAPIDGTATYQWYRHTSSSNSGGTLIVGATDSSYTPMSDDVGKYLYVVANGTGGSTGRVVSSPTTSAVQWGTIVATPSFSIAAGSYAGAQSVSISCATDDATVYYTTDGSTPTSGSTKYTGAITVSSTITIKAIAIKAECGDSAVASVAYIIFNVTATPYTGTYDGAAHDAVTVTGTLAGDTITYSTDGKTFSSACPQYTDAGSYIIYVKVTSASHADWESGLTTAVISRAAGSILITGDPSKAYDGGEVEDPAITKNGTGAVTYTYYNDNGGVIGTVLSGAPSAAGTYWVKAQMAPDTNYTAAEDTKKFTISASLTVIYHGNLSTGGSVPVDDRKYAKDDTVIVKDNAGYLTRTGYTFTGWNTSADGLGQYYGAGDTFSIQDSTALYAVWNMKSFTVRFVNWDGSILKTQTVNFGDSATEPTPPDRIGYTFTGWNQAFDSVESDLTVTAMYTAKTNTVAFNTQGGGSITNVSVNYGTFLTPPSDPERSGYIFGGWFKDAACKSAWNFSTDKVMDNVTLYAKWTANVAKINNGIDVLPNPDTATDKEIADKIKTIVDTKAAFDDLNPEQKAAVGEAREQKLNKLIDRLNAILIIKPKDYTMGVTITGVGTAVMIPELKDENVNKVVVEVIIKKLDTTQGSLAIAGDALNQNGREMLMAFDASLLKTVYNKNGTSSSCKVSNSDITGLITVRVPLPKEYKGRSNLAIAYVDVNGNVTDYETKLVTIDGVQYLEFQTNHFSSYAIIEKEQSGTDVTVPEPPQTGDAATSLGFGMLSLAALYAGYLVMKRRKA